MSNQKLHDYYLKKNGSLSEKYPEIAAEWHPTKNGSLTPNDVTSKTATKVWWLGKCGHEWQATVDHRTPHNNMKGTGCPFCSNPPKRVLAGFNDLQTTRPDLAKEWHPTKNRELRPTDCITHSNKTVWWKCQYGHEWKAKISDRAAGNGCPKCSSNGTSLPEQGIAFYLEQVCRVQQRIKIAGQEIDIYLPDYKIGIEYDGRFYHKATQVHKELEKDRVLYEDGIKLIRIKESDVNNIDGNVIFFETDYLGSNYEWALNNLCKMLALLTGNNKFISVQIDTQNDLLNIRERVNLYIKENSVQTLLPELAKEWNYDKNLSLRPEMFTTGAQTKVWWKCALGHEWQSTIGNRTRGNGCPYCSGKIIIKGENDLETLRPDLAKEWHPIKNGDLKPSDIMLNCNKKVWWLGKCGHEWQSSSNSRVTSNTGCPVCSGKQVLEGFNDLQTKFPQLCEEWNYEKNNELGLLPTNVAPASDKRVWWRCCVCGHEWKSVIGNRTVLGRGCPKCGKEKQIQSAMINRIAKVGSLREKRPDVAEEWHPIKNGSLTPDDVTIATNKVIWWQCKEGHEWKTYISNRTYRNSKCPYCRKNASIERNRKKAKKVRNYFLCEKIPALAAELHPTKNGDLKPTEVDYRSQQSVWWQCSKCGYEWQTKIYSRVHAKTGCPRCSDKNHKRVLCIETGIVYKDLSEASMAVFGNKKNITNISNVCKGKRKVAGNYHWRFED